MWPSSDAKPIRRVALLARHSRYWAHVAAARQAVGASWRRSAASRGTATTVVACMRVAMLTREYPPEVYGGAGVHVPSSSRSCASSSTSTCTAWAPTARRRVRPPARPGARGRQPGAVDAAADLEMAERRRRPPSCTRTPGTPTWPASSAALLHGIPHVLTAHSLEPLRPWKAEQLGGGYRISSWVERTPTRRPTPSSR